LEDRCNGCVQRRDVVQSSVDVVDQELALLQLNVSLAADAQDAHVVHQARQRVQQSRFSCAVLADDSYGLSSFDREIQIANGVPGSVGVFVAEIDRLQLHTGANRASCRAEDDGLHVGCVRWHDRAHNRTQVGGCLDKCREEELALIHVFSDTIQAERTRKSRSHA
jgi:hypothetical protein